jgi:DNA-directed RNA polymerase beta subunit
VIDVRHLDKFTLENKRLVCFGEVKVTAGDELEEGAIISMEPNGKPLQFWNKTDRSLVVDVTKTTLAFNAQEKEVTVVHIETKHRFKEGVKFTNRHGNKGVVSFADCGTMLDEGRNEIVPIDIIVSAKTLSKRRNYGQVLEALLTLVGGKDKKAIIPDDSEISLLQLEKHLAKKGYNPDGTSPVTTQWLLGLN